MRCRDATWMREEGPGRGTEEESSRGWTVPGTCGGLGSPLSSQRGISGTLKPGGRMISSSSENDSHFGVTNGLDVGEWEVGMPAARLLQERGQL